MGSVAGHLAMLFGLDNLHRKIECGEIDGTKPMFDPDDEKCYRDGVEFGCPIGCGKTLMLQVNTIAEYDRLIGEHRKECASAKFEMQNTEELQRKNQVQGLKMIARQANKTTTGYLMGELAELINEFHWSATIPKARVKELLAKYSTGVK